MSPIRPTCGYSSASEWMRMTIRAIPRGGSATVSLAESGCPTLNQLRNLARRAAASFRQLGRCIGLEIIVRAADTTGWRGTWVDGRPR